MVFFTTVGADVNLHVLFGELSTEKHGLNPTGQLLETPEFAGKWGC